MMDEQENIQRNGDRKWRYTRDYTFESRKGKDFLWNKLRIQKKKKWEEHERQDNLRKHAARKSAMKSVLTWHGLNEQLVWSCRSLVVKRAEGLNTAIVEWSSGMQSDDESKQTKGGEQLRVTWWVEEREGVSRLESFIWERLQSFISQYLINERNIICSLMSPPLLFLSESLDCHSFSVDDLFTSLILQLIFSFFFLSHWRLLFTLSFLNALRVNVFKRLSHTHTTRFWEQEDNRQTWAHMSSSQKKISLSFERQCNVLCVTWRSPFLSLHHTS